ncbi:aldehyde dehydrogenase family protein [Bacillaceae bacterium SIJ1]|uniref:aldehyde dehydrogenase family protein n=1 Tax=Litoribacterium kuwaitense TaxID=1398745 RepID=UPI0013EBA7F8|nr:aldehyde dehydrogenase family protein [Litoribacterium kuwaitense]NGP45713.1 aldehyde dehydrogenase family protein [Litoribacterium kuwaitense]
MNLRKYGLLINGQEIVKTYFLPVQQKYTGNLLAEVSVAEKDDVDRAVDASMEGQNLVLPPYQRYQILHSAASLLRERKEDLAHLMTDEVGKPIIEARTEVERAAMTLEISAEEAKRIQGQGIPVEASPGAEERRAFTIKVPVGVVAAITPFNVPLNLACHKIGPALAAGNSVIVKPAEKTPLSTIYLANLLLEAGLPHQRLHVLTGHGPDIGRWLTDNPNVHMFTFTGSPRVGEQLRKQAGLRKVALELGNNSATIVHKDADIREAAKLVSMRSFNSAGQVCISVQRVFVHADVYNEFLEQVVDHTKQLHVGDPHLEDTQVGPMISESEAQRVEAWVNEAVADGAKLETGGLREGAIYHPTILTNVTETMKVCKDEVFGPVVTMDTYEDADDVFERVNRSQYGLQAGVFSMNMRFCLGAAEKLNVGGVIINDTSAFRVDAMPYGGVKKSGTGKEGPRYAMEDMMTERLVVLR